MAITNYQTLGPHQNPGSDTLGEREDLANVISMITRDETPFMSSIGTTKATAILHEWQTDELDSPGFQAQVEGLDYTETGFNVTEIDRRRLANSTQIFAKKLAVTGTTQHVNKAGVANEYAYQLKKRGTELKRDIEFGLIHTWQSRNGSGTRRFGGIQTYIDSENVYDANAGTFNAAVFDMGETGTYDTGTISTTTTSITLSDIDVVMQNIYEEGGKAGTIMVSPANRREISAQAQAAGNVRRNIDASGSLRQSVDIYMSDFGDVKVVPNYIMGLSHTVTNAAANGAGPTNATGFNAANFCAIVYDPMWFSIAQLRPFQQVDVGQVGDSMIGMLVEECSLEVRNPRGWGLITNIGA